MYIHVRLWIENIEQKNGILQILSQLNLNSTNSECCCITRTNSCLICVKMMRIMDNFMYNRLKTDAQANKKKTPFSVCKININNMRISREVIRRSNLSSLSWLRKRKFWSLRGLFVTIHLNTSLTIFFENLNLSPQ